MAGTITPVMTWRGKGVGDFRDMASAQWSSTSDLEIAREFFQLAGDLTSALKVLEATSLVWTPPTRWVNREFLNRVPRNSHIRKTRVAFHLRKTPGGLFRSPRFTLSSIFSDKLSLIADLESNYEDERRIRLDILEIGHGVPPQEAVLLPAVESDLGGGPTRISMYPFCSSVVFDCVTGTGTVLGRRSEIRNFMNALES
jgi:hypothetical protein